MFDAESRAMLITNATFMGLSGIAVFLRINVRKQKLQPLKADDYLIIAAWVGSYTYKELTLSDTNPQSRSSPQH